MLIAPHPDDEALACSVILQRALQSDVSVRVVYVTDGDNNPWPQRFLEKKWRLLESDRQRWGKLRQGEALAALRALGLTDDCVCFLGLPDQGLTDLVLRDRASVVTRLAGPIQSWNPTDILAPSIFDTHPDHSATAIIMRLALRRVFALNAAIRHFTYLVHGRSVAFSKSAIPFVQSETETRKKIRAIECHRTQTRLSRRRFLSYAARPERLGCGGITGAADGPIQSVDRTDTTIRIVLRLRMKPWLTDMAQLQLIGKNLRGVSVSLRIPIPARAGHVEMINLEDGEAVGRAFYMGSAFSGEMLVPTDEFSSGDSLFIKLDRPSWFFDEAGWLEVPPIAMPLSSPAVESWPRDEFVTIR
jgi:LmbE family N-acetylglucosaminyl deacetylase